MIIAAIIVIILCFCWMCWARGLTLGTRLVAANSRGMEYVVADGYTLLVQHAGRIRW